MSYLEYKQLKREYLELKNQSGGADKATIRQKLEAIKLLTPAQSSKQCNQTSCGLVTTQLLNSCDCKLQYRDVLADLVRKYKYIVFSNQEPLYGTIKNTDIKLIINNQNYTLDSPVPDDFATWINCIYLNIKSQCSIPVPDISMDIKVKVDLDSSKFLPSQEMEIDGFSENLKISNLWITKNWIISNDHKQLSTEYIIESRKENLPVIKRFTTNKPNEEKLVNEFISSERNYVIELYKMIDDYFVPKFVNADDKLDIEVDPGHKVSEGVTEDWKIYRPQVEKLYQSLKIIAYRHHEFLHELTQEESSLGFIIVMNRFFTDKNLTKDYINYINAYNDLGKNINKNFNKILGYRANDRLIQPIQRLPRYKLLLSELVKISPGYEQTQKLFEKNIDLKQLNKSI